MIHIVFFFGIFIFRFDLEMGDYWDDNDSDFVSKENLF